MGRQLRKGILKYVRTAKIQTAQSGQDLRCSFTQNRDLIEGIGCIAKISARRVAVQTGLGLRYSYMLQGPYCQPGGHLTSTRDY